MTQHTPIPIATIQDGCLYGTVPDLAQVVTDSLHLEGGRIVGMGVRPVGLNQGAVLQAENLHVLPGFLDLHVHGGGGHDTMDADPEAVNGMGQFHARHGTTGFMPTTTTAAKERIRESVAAVAEAAQRGMAGARILGVHVEGPFISPDYPGAQNPEYIVPPDLAFVDELMTCGPVRLMTIAPEIPGGQELIHALDRHGIVPVMGHTACTWREAQAGSAWGVRQATHTYNAMRGLHHREPGALGWVMQDPAIYAQLIADNIHVHPGAMRILALCKSFARILLITDAIRATGLPEGIYDLGSLPVTVRDGACRLPDGTLAGSVLTMERALDHLITATQSDLAHAWPASSLTAAQSCGLEGKLGRLQAGYWADLTLLTGTLEVAATIVNGTLQYLHPDCRDRLQP